MPTRTNRPHACKPPGVQPRGTTWACAHCRLEYEYQPVNSRELGRVVDLWVRIKGPSWTPYGNPKAAK